ncbi:hypothetical protein PHLGIDRAFT_534792 [Phlebiopsis gigantea 11061_1 CR5-6]|uniref:B mating type pheromone n=1 Tax=Phlebiopsis gigantea (strain 11061_1 CR5-6) TaxID=745531 RepID=A0A0C3NPS6_PHLG1|nr:hypothetical protein PHLGIDRAFT_534792 [Phlebiopsis gigantea 11061_1 CR5-6]
MDAFFTLAAPVPATAPEQELPSDRDSTGNSGITSSCTIA